jgi:hypothetical protein
MYLISMVDMAIKMAIVYRHYTLEQAEENRGIIRREQEVWRRTDGKLAKPPLLELDAGSRSVLQPL